MRIALVLLLASGALAGFHAASIAFAHGPYLAEHMGAWAPWAGPLLVGAGLLSALAAALACRREPPAPHALLGLAGCIAFATWLAVLAWAQPPRPLVIEIAAAGASALLACLTLLSRRSSLPERAWAWAPTRAVLRLAGSLLLLEAGLRAFDAWRPHPVLVRESTSVQQNLRALRPAPGTMIRGFPCDSAGHYDAEPPRPPRERPLVVCIGDSFSAGVVPHPMHYTSVAEQGLGGVEIYNMGMPAIDVPEYLWLLENEARPLQPDAIVIALFVGNDLAPARAPRSSVLVQAFERENLLAWILPRRLLVLRREGLLGLTPATELAAEGPRLETVEELTAALPWLFEPGLEPPAYSPEAYREIEVDRAHWTCDADRADYDRLWVWLGDLIDAASGIPLHFLILPDEFQVEDAVWQDVLAHGRGARLDRDQPQRLLRAWFEERGLAYCDPLAELRAVPPLADGRKHVYHLRDSHFNVRGNRIVGEALARFLSDRVPAAASR
jgi:hypothetical protein